MKAFVQRVRGSTGIVSRVSGQPLRSEQFEGPGLVVLLAWLKSDLSVEFATQEAWLRSRVQGLRIFPDAQDRMNLNLNDYLDAQSAAPGSGGILWVSQFTLGARLESGFRPSFGDALDADTARARFDIFRQTSVAQSLRYPQIFGTFGADMEITFTNWGPLSIPLEI